MSNKRSPLFYALYNGLRKSQPQLPPKMAWKIANKKFKEILADNTSQLKYKVGNNVAEKFASSDIVYDRLEVK